VRFETAVATHMNAVLRRDLAAHHATLHEAVTIVLPNGKLLAGRDQVSAFHKDWFADPDWQLRYAVVHSVETGDTGVAVLSVDYDDVTAEGTPYAMKYLLSLVFARQGEGWLLVHDQNTPC
jgi:uncharacterized protein (TIGR02246 family)